MNEKNSEISKNIVEKSLKVSKKPFNPIKKVVIAVSTVMSISLLFTACSSILNNIKVNNIDNYTIENPVKIEVLGEVEEKEYKKYDIYTVKHRLNLLSSNLIIKLEKYGINIYDYKNLTPEDYKKIEHGLSDQELISLYYTLGKNINEVEKVVISMGYADIKDYFEKNGYVNEYDWMDQMFQKVYDIAVGQKPPKEKVK